MARKLSFIPALTGPGIVPLSEIPEDIVSDIEEAYAALANSNGRIRAEFDTKEEADLFCRYAASYVAQRPEGALKFRRSPTRELKKFEGKVVDFTVKADVEENGKRRAASPTGSAKAGK